MSDYAEATAALAAAMQAADERQRYYTARPGEGVPIGFDPPADPWRPAPAGLGYSRPPRPDAIYEADKPGLVPHVLPVPLAFDASAPESVTGSTHGWGIRPAGGDSVAYVGLGDAGPPRRSLFSRLLGRRH